MHLNILNNQQQKQLELLQMFKREFVMVGGTAIALQIGHRRSIDFDLFKFNNVNTSKIKFKLKEKTDFDILYEDNESLHLIISEVKWTFFRYPFDISTSLINEKYFKIPDLLTLAAMKAYALGRRSKWKDYVDLFYLLSNSFSIEEVNKRAKEIFGDSYSSKMFKVQLVYFDDIDYSETVEWLSESFSIEKIQSELIKIVTD